MEQPTDRNPRMLLILYNGIVVAGETEFAIEAVFRFGVGIGIGIEIEIGVVSIFMLIMVIVIVMVMVMVIIMVMVIVGGGCEFGSVVLCVYMLQCIILY